MKNKTIVFIIGIPGSGKTCFSQRLSIELGIVPLVSTDIVKFMVSQKSNDPFLKKVSHNAWKLIGEYNEKNIIVGYKEFSKSLFRETYYLIKQIFNTYNLVIVEGMGISLELVNNICENHVEILLKNQNIEHALKNKLRYRNNKNNNWECNQFAIKIIEKYIKETCFNSFPDLIYGDISDSNILLKRAVRSINEIEAIDGGKGLDIL